MNDLPLPLVHVTALIVGITAILLIRNRYPKISTKELIVIVILYIALVLLFTEPVVNYLFNMFLSS